MEKIYEILAKKNVSGELGVEIEAEGVNLPPTNLLVWGMKDDNSLRGHWPDTRCEYVMPAPKSLGKTLEAIKALEDAGKEAGTKWEFSFRTSCHVHLNVLNFTEDQLKALVYLYLLVEEPMINFCGKTRKNNRFCLRTQDAENTIELITHLITKGVHSFTRSYEDGQIRYSALNLAAIKKYGSVEFRGMRGTIDYGVLSNWVTAITRLRDYSLKYPTVKEIYQRFVSNTPEQFLEEVFGDIWKLFTYKGVDYDMRLAFSISLEIPHVYKRVSEKPKKEEVLFFENALNKLADEVVRQAAPRRRAQIIAAPENFVVNFPAA